LHDFHTPDPDSTHVDWPASGGGFERAHFDALWRDVTRFAGG
jgi:hypothetical protein